MQMEGRMEGFERYIESLFQSGGIYEQDGVSSVLRSLRPKRRAHPPGLNAEKLKAMDEQFDAASHFRDEPQVIVPIRSDPISVTSSCLLGQMSLSMKVLGKELGYGHWEGSDEIKRSISQLNPVTSIQRLLNGEEMSYTYAGRVLDAAYVIPLASGFPLRLEGRANVVADVRGSVSADLSSFFSKASAHLTWKMHPSVAANFEASLTVDALFIKGELLMANLDVWSGRARTPALPPLPNVAIFRAVVPSRAVVMLFPTFKSNRYSKFSHLSESFDTILKFFCCSWS